MYIYIYIYIYIYRGQSDITVITNDNNKYSIEKCKLVPLQVSTVVAAQQLALHDYAVYTRVGSSDHPDCVSNHIDSY